MLPEEKQQALIDQYGIIDDVQERLTLLMDRARRMASLPEGEKTEAARVHGCSSRVWVVSSVEEGRCRFRTDADSALVRSLAALVCEIYDGASAAEVRAVEPRVLEELQILPNLSPTRRHGLQQIRRTILEFALAQEETLSEASL
jgi:cysteine desulfuration protein SufE